VEEHGCVRHLRFDSPAIVMMNGKTSQGMIFKPGGGLEQGSGSGIQDGALK
jgi:hypothetical protein